MLKSGTIRFVFPDGHPHHGKTIEVEGVQFVDGVHECSRDDAARIESRLYHFAQAAVEGSLELDQLQEEFDANPEIAALAEKQRAREEARREAAEKARADRAARRKARAEKPSEPPQE